MQTESSRPAAFASCFRRIAALSPAGPAPTITTSYCMDSRSLMRSSPRRGLVAGAHIRLICPANSLTLPSMAVRMGSGWGSCEIDRRAEARSALAWWLEAGVDVAIQEEPRDWLKSPPPDAAARRRTGSRPRMCVSPARRRSPSFRNGSPAAPSCRLPARRPGAILPHGPEDAAVMLLSDARRSRILRRASRSAARPGCSRKRMLAAIGIGADQAYSASLSCFPAPGIRMSEQGSGGLRRNRAPAYRARAAEAAAAARRRAVAGVARQAAAASARPCPQDRGRARGRHLPPPSAD